MKYTLKKKKVIWTPKEKREKKKKKETISYTARVHSLTKSNKAKPN